MKIFRVDVPIFDISIVVCTDCSKEEAKDAFYDYEGKRTIVDMSERCVGRCGLIDGDIYLWVESPNEFARHVFHEIVHAAQFICEAKGMEKDDELIAYLVAWLKVEVADKIFFE